MVFEAAPLLVVGVCICLAVDGLATAVLRAACLSFSGALLLALGVMIWNGIRQLAAS